MILSVLFCCSNNYGIEKSTKIPVVIQHNFVREKGRLCPSRLLVDCCENMQPNEIALKPKATILLVFSDEIIFPMYRNF